MDQSPLSIFTKFGMGEGVHCQSQIWLDLPEMAKICCISGDTAVCAGLNVYQS